MHKTGSRYAANLRKAKVESQAHGIKEISKVFFGIRSYDRLQVQRLKENRFFNAEHLSNTLS